MFVSIQKKGSRFEFIAGESLSDDPSFRFRSSEDFYLVEGLRSTYASYAEAHDAAMWLTTFRPSHIQAKKASRCIAEIGDQILSPEDSAVSHYNEQITIDELASLVHVSPSHFAATFKETKGISPIEMLIRTRISRAKEFLEYTNFPTKRIASECGFNSTQYFARLFSKRVGQSPKQFRSTVHHSYVGASSTSSAAKNSTPIQEHW